MSRFDKYGPFVGGFRAKLGFAIASTDIGKLFAVSVTTTGVLQKGGTAATAVNGVVCPVRAMAIGEPIDVMTSGEVANATTTGGAAFTAGALVYSHINGDVDATATSGVVIGKMVELDRMIVRVPTATTMP
jgi:hypothetical protein